MHHHPPPASVAHFWAPCVGIGHPSSELTMATQHDNFMSQYYLVLQVQVQTTVTLYQRWHYHGRGDCGLRSRRRSEKGISALYQHFATVSCAPLARQMRPTGTLRDVPSLGQSNAPSRTVWIPARLHRRLLVVGLADLHGAWRMREM